VVWPTVFTVHVGHNRVYHLSHRRLTQLTEDHTMAAKLVQAGVLSPRRASASRLRNVVWNVVDNYSERIAPQFIETHLRPNDALVWCSAGVDQALGDCEIQRLLATSRSAAAACHNLVGSAANDDDVAIVARLGPVEPCR
ncbi:MAG: hypothetical protein KDA99_13755, partial [Planctomycetales bacterium]|nr:hypothetical protein [Planctomycetales bacterium]